MTVLQLFEPPAILPVPPARWQQPRDYSLWLCFFPKPGLLCQKHDLPRCRLPTRLVRPLRQRPPRSKVPRTQLRSTPAMNSTSKHPVLQTVYSRSACKWDSIGADKFGSPHTGQQRRAEGHERRTVVATGAPPARRAPACPTAPRAGVVITRKSPTHKYAIWCSRRAELN